MNSTMTRQLHMVIAGAEVNAVVRIGPTEPDNVAGWRCHWAIDHVCLKGGKFRGRDELDAFSRCYKFVNQLLRGSEDDGLVVWWQEPGDHGGFD
jgi:hypothetical protein